MSVECIVYFGTPEFAVQPLEALVGAGREPGLVITQPARRQGRGMKARRSAVGEAAARLGLPVAEVASVRDDGFRQRLRDLEPGLAVVAAFGQIFDQELLDLPRLGCLNIHASLLPAYRGAAPIQAAIAAGEIETGVSLMWMERGLDTGPVIAAKCLAIGADETAPELSQRLASLGAELLVSTLGGVDLESADAEPQDDDHATYAPQLARDDGRVDWTLAASTVYDRWRAYQPWPGLFVEHAGEAIKLDRVTADAQTQGAAPGIVAGVVDDRLQVACGEGVLEIVEARRPGRGPVSGRDLANGLRLSAGDRFGDLAAPASDADGAVESDA